MTPEDLTLLQSAEDRILALELTTGEQFFAEIVILVVDQLPHPRRLPPPRYPRPRRCL